MSNQNTTNGAYDNMYNKTGGYVTKLKVNSRKVCFIIKNFNIIEILTTY